MTRRYLDACSEFIDLYSSIDRYQKENNYDAVINKINNVKNPLNFYDKYLLKLNFEASYYKYSEAIKTLDSLILYCPPGELRDSLVENHNNLVDYFHDKINFLETRSNGIYYYALDSLYNDFTYYLNFNHLPIWNLKEACFEINTQHCSITDSVLECYPVDTSNSNSKKLDILSFARHSYKAGNDTLVVVKFRFIDTSSFKIYEVELQTYRYTQPLNKSLAYHIENCDGQEYLINGNVIAGLFRNNNFNYPVFELYLYCFVNSGKVSDLSSLFIHK